MEQFSGIPVKALLQNDEKTTALDLSRSGCAHTEALVLAECLKVAESSCFLECSVFSWLPPGLSPGNPSSLVVLFVQVNSTVTDLNLRFNEFGDAGTIALSEALKVSFVFFRERSPFSWLPPPLVTHLFWLFCLYRSTNQ